MMKGMNIYLKPLNISDATSILELEIKNKEFFSQYSINRDSEFYTLEGQLKRMETIEESRENDLGYSFGIYLNESHRLIGQISLFKIERGPAQRGMVGYSLDKDQNGKGYMTEALKSIVDFGFDQLKLHRIEAGVMPHNIGSIKILEKTGFQKEGIAKKYVMINGKWEDHQILAIINNRNE
ncbi:GNAT family N-acetyltransferase [Fictibacillus barbaricus]|uniref:GNAT family N-acetyltransferase n=1 Tax=Fictibacillus barbaricus TaxID=182136 RepID=A0ABS2Z8J6_9BACL|nr:GNAT family protein [Fictibacillus barbaricus]MBN3543961.1 GNAT family N-acetyltransferase [Fictibacillus barbaricus]